MFLIQPRAKGKVFPSMRKKAISFLPIGVPVIAVTESVKPQKTL
jgi:hypothetical protein